MGHLVSIITPCYQSERFLEEAIRSVQDQTHQNWEMILVDDASKDATKSIIERLQKEDSRLKLICNEVNLGVARTRNVGLDQASGSFIAFLDSDDLWLPNKLERQLDFMQQRNISLCYSAYNIIDNVGNLVRRFKPRLKVCYSDLLKSSDIGTLTTIYNARELGKIYFKDIGHEDYFMKLQMLKRIPYAEAIAEPLASYRLTEGSRSRNKIKAAKWQWNIYRNVERLSLRMSAYYFGHYFFKGLCKNSAVPLVVSSSVKLL